MDRIQHSSATSTHQFTEGDPGNGVPATTVTAIHMNGVQNELVHIIEQAGLTPDEANHTQVLQALGELFLAKDAESSTPVLEALVSNAVSGILTLDLGTRATSVVVVVKGNSSSSLTLRLAGTVPSGSTVTVFNWNPGALTVALASGTLTGNSGTLALGDVAIVTKDTASTAWWLAVIPTRGTVASLIQNAVSGEANLRSAADTTLQQNLNQEASTRSSADATAMQVIGGVNSLLNTRTTVEEFGTGWATVTQADQHDLLTIPLDETAAYMVDGFLTFTVGTGESQGPTHVVAILVDTVANVVLGKFSLGKMNPIPSTANGFELFGTTPFRLKVAATSQIKLQVWGMVGTGGGATFNIQATAYVQEVAA